MFKIRQYRIAHLPGHRDHCGQDRHKFLAGTCSTKYFPEVSLDRPDKAIKENDIQDPMENRWNTMDPRLVDIIIAVVAFAVLVILMVLLPLYLSAGIAYLIAIIIFIIMISGAGIMINLKANPGKAK
jgi:hypothetical protein